MVDSISIVAIIVAIGACTASVLTHVKHSDCFKGLLNLDTRTPPASPLNPTTTQQPIISSPQVSRNGVSHRQLPRTPRPSPSQSPIPL